MTSKKLMTFAIGSFMIGTTLVACANSSPASSFCDIYRPVYTVDDDTEETKQQIDGNNAAWLILCTKVGR